MFEFALINKLRLTNPNMIYDKHHIMYLFKYPYCLFTHYTRSMDRLNKIVKIMYWVQLDFNRNVGI